MKAILIIFAILFSSSAYASHGGLWHEPSARGNQLNPNQSVYSPPTGYSGNEQAQQREYERQLEQQRQQENDRQTYNQPSWAR